MRSGYANREAQVDKPSMNKKEASSLKTSASSGETPQEDGEDAASAETIWQENGYLPEGDWIMDSGCGHDLIDVDTADRYCLARGTADKALFLNTANGQVLVEDQAPAYCRELDQEISPYVLQVLSLGKRVMKMGYSFYWPAGKSPVLITPSKRVVKLVVKSDIPYLRVGEKYARPREPK